MTQTTTTTDKPSGRYCLTVGKMGGSMEKSLKACYRLVEVLSPDEAWTIDQEMVNEDGETYLGREIAHARGSA